MTEDASVKSILEDIETKLELQLALYRLVNSERLEEETDRLLSNPTRKKIYDLCDGMTSGALIAKKVSTTKQNVSYHMSALAGAGLLFPKTRNGRKFYGKSFE